MFVCEIDKIRNTESTMFIYLYHFKNSEK